MGKPSVLSAVLLLCTVLMHTDAEQEYFTLSTNLTWEEARSHCQMCFSDLVTLTPFNIRNISQRISSAHWIGLRKYFNSTGSSTTGNGTTNSSVPWTQWADGAPLVFQNWYPGWPVFKSPLPKIECCSCSCTCPARVSPTSAPTRGYTESPDSNNTGSNVPDASTTDAILRHGPSESPAGYRITDPTDATTPDAPDTTQSHWVSTPPTPIASTCERSPMLPPIVPEELQNYVEDSCVAMLSFGPWVERDCSDPLPFICYEDRFYGEVNVSGITATSASVAWQRGPDGISHHRLQVVGGNETWVQNLTELSRDLDRLTPGTGYSVEVFAVKCGRDLNPQTTIFYTTPEEVQDLNVVKVTERSVTLNWTEPEGQFDFFLVKSPSDDVEVTTEEAEVKNLMPGGCFTFSVLTGVQDRSRWSEASPIAACTKPEKVSDLKVSDNTNMSLVLSWTPPEGNFTGFQVVALSVNKTLLFNETRGRGETSAVVTGLPNGSEIRLFVTALGRDGLRGDTVSVVDFTAPGPISHLVVVTKDTSLNADWKPAEGGPLTFTTELLWEKTVVKTKDVVNETSVMFDTLNTTTEYTVVVYAVIGILKSPPITASKFTLAAPPRNFVAKDVKMDSITLHWSPPPNVTKATYLVEVRSGFWNESFQNETQKTTFTFDRLRSGTNYTCEVMTQAGDDKSPPVNLTEMTVADKVEIGLSMMCSSADSLQCENETKVMKEIHDYLESNLKEHIFWKFN
ncbi:receptor-type tyrosine-protein phosphatase H isoform 2-T2 [Menidia menidia]